jgi:hypothetical protein
MNFFSEIQNLFKKTLNFRPLEDFCEVFWYNFNNLNILEEIYSKDNGFLSFNVIILTVVSKFWVGVSKK